MLIRDLIEIKERVDRDDFVLKLTAGVAEPEKTLGDYVVTKDLVGNFDDALGFSDPERLARMGAVFDTVGADGQVIVLTCAADRYSGVSTAHTVELSVS